MTDKIKVSPEVYEFVAHYYTDEEEYNARFGNQLWDKQARHHEKMCNLGDMHWWWKRPPDMTEEFYDLLYQNSKLGNLWSHEVMQNWPTPVPKRTIDDYEIVEGYRADRLPLQVKRQVQNLLDSYKWSQETDHRGKKRGPKNQKEVADMLGVAQSRVSRMLGKENNITLNTLSKLVEALGGEVEIKITPNYTKGKS